MTEVEKVNCLRYDLQKHREKTDEIKRVLGID